MTIATLTDQLVCASSLLQESCPCPFSLTRRFNVDQVLVVFDHTSRKSLICAELRADDPFGLAGFKGSKGTKREATLEVLFEHSVTIATSYCHLCIPALPTYVCVCVSTCTCACACRFTICLCIPSLPLPAAPLPFLIAIFWLYPCASNPYHYLEHHCHS